MPSGMYLSIIICFNHSLAALLSKFRIDYSDVVIISDIHKKAMDSTRKEFETFIEPFRVKDGDSSDTSKSMLSRLQINEVTSVLYECHVQIIFKKKVSLLYIRYTSYLNSSKLWLKCSLEQQF